MSDIGKPERITQDRVKRDAVWQAAVEHSGVETARRPLWMDEVSDGFTTLWELKRRELHD